VKQRCNGDPSVNLAAALPDGVATFTLPPEVKAGHAVVGDDLADVAGVAHAGDGPDKPAAGAVFLKIKSSIQGSTSQVIIKFEWTWKKGESSRKTRRFSLQKPILTSI
jgi:hypothetical protein